MPLDAGRKRESVALAEWETVDKLRALWLITLRKEPIDSVFDLIIVLAIAESRIASFQIES